MADSTIKNERKMKRVVIMGASSGIGYGMAEALASRGVPVGVAARHTKALEELRSRYPDKVVCARIDITHRSAPELLEELISRLGGMDIYFHASGIGTENPELDPEKEVDLLKTNVCGFARMICAATRYFRKAGTRGHIAAITSVAGTNSLGRLPAYSASKAFDSKYLLAIEQYVRRERLPITFTDIRPGWIKTPLVIEDREYPMQMTVDHVVPLILKAIVKGKRVAIIDWRWNLLVALWQRIPDSLWLKLGTYLYDKTGALPIATKK